MSNWDKFNKDEPQKPEDLPHYEVGGTFMCQHCDGYTFEATYFYTDYVLKWVCSNGHVSFAENFKL